MTLSCSYYTGSGGGYLVGEHPLPLESCSFLMYIYFERESACTGVRGVGVEGQSKRERESQADSLLTKEPSAGLDPTTLRS